MMISLCGTMSLTSSITLNVTNEGSFRPHGWLGEKNGEEEGVVGYFATHWNANEWFTLQVHRISTWP